MIAPAPAAVMSARSFREGQAQRRLPSAAAEWSTFLVRRLGRRGPLVHFPAGRTPVFWKRESKMSKEAEEARARAEARYRKQHEEDKAAEQVKADREAQAHAVEAKTTRLKVLRTAKEAADKQSGSSETPTRKKKR